MNRSPLIPDPGFGISEPAAKVRDGLNAAGAKIDAQLAAIAAAEAKLAAIDPAKFGPAEAKARAKLRADTIAARQAELVLLRRAGAEWPQVLAAERVASLERAESALEQAAAAVRKDLAMIGFIDAEGQIPGQLPIRGMSLGHPRVREAAAERDTAAERVRQTSREASEARNRERTGDPTIVEAAEQRLRELIAAS